ncbi:hypothetical protein DOTSEDRAFT_53006 [Dothistroma septosporum NZE10]|uniref:Uncharacterized protein n=1 Tax=Dothistroma septosporum (strain NZE10 / CBS 128990) TaxID=675120 RepID=N1PU10_DOTSN|nr:hypothetical protein DOTSEDRAFT_53006 [Dothistroma septosporum NZE10]
MYADDDDDDDATIAVMEGLDRILSAPPGSVRQSQLLMPTHATTTANHEATAAITEELDKILSAPPDIVQWDQPFIPPQPSTSAADSQQAEIPNPANSSMAKISSKGKTRQVYLPHVTSGQTPTPAASSATQDHENAALSPISRTTMRTKDREDDVRV